MILLNPKGHDRFYPDADALEAPPAALQRDLQDLIIVLFEVSPTETTYFLQQILENSEKPLTTTTMRRMFPALPQELQIKLRDVLRKPR